MPDHKRIGTLVAFVKAFEISALDDALDVLDLLITEITGQAKRLGKQNRLRTLKDLNGNPIALRSADHSDILSKVRRQFKS